MYGLFDQQVKEAIKSKKHFAYEGHFRNASALKIVRKFKKQGYYLSLIFMGLTNPAQSELRVIDRAKHGGHFVPLYEIESNFYGNLVMLNKNYKLFDEVLILDTSVSLQHNVLLHMRNLQVLSYFNTKNQPRWFTKFLPRLVKAITESESTVTK